MSAEPDYEFEGCPECEMEAEEDGIEYEANASWDEEQRLWICDNCRRGC